MHFPHTLNTNSTSGLLATRKDEKTRVCDDSSRKKKRRGARKRSVLKMQQQVFVCVIGDYTHLKATLIF